MSWIPGNWQTINNENVWNPFNKTILPTSDDAYDIGSPLYRWKSLYLSENCFIEGDLDIKGLVVLHGGLELTGDLNITGDFSVSGYSDLHNTGITGTLDVTGLTSLKDTEITGTLTVTDLTSLKDTDITGTLDVTGSASVSTDLTITGKILKSSLNDKGVIYYDTTTGLKNLTTFKYNETYSQLITPGFYISGSVNRGIPYVFTPSSPALPYFKTNSNLTLKEWGSGVDIVSMKYLTLNTLDPTPVVGDNGCIPYWQSYYDVLAVPPYPSRFGTSKDFYFQPSLSGVDGVII